VRFKEHVWKKESVVEKIKHVLTKQQQRIQTVTLDTSYFLVDKDSFDVALAAVTLCLAGTKLCLVYIYFQIISR